MVAVTKHVRGRDELGERVEELERPKHQLGAAVYVGFWEPVEKAALRLSFRIVRWRMDVLRSSGTF